jgi:replicative DNA helicase
MLYDFTLQQKLITSILKYPQEWLSVKSFFSEDDVVDGDYKDSLVVSLVRQAVEKGEAVDANIIAQRIERMNLNIDTDMSLAQYVLSLGMRNCAEGSVLRIAKELKKLSLRRELAATGEEIKKRMESLDPSASYSEIIETSDSIYNKKVNHFELDGDIPVNIYDDMERIIEEAGKNQDEAIFGKFPTVNKIYGSLHKPGNITCITSRSGSGKTTLAMDECCFVGDKYDIPVLHFDNGEMSIEELTFRRASSLSEVPHHLIESGKWRNNPLTAQKVRDALNKIKSGKSKFYYYCVAGMTADEMVGLATKFYYSTVGRGKKMILSFDYIKTTNQLGGSMTEWQVVGEIVDKFKKFVQKDILFENRPMVSMFTSVQSNRMGVTTNKKADQIVDDESTVSLSDRIIQFCSHMFILRKKTMDEIAEEGVEFGTHKLICIKARHLGEDVMGHLEPVKVGDKLRQNFINLQFANFALAEKGDLRNIARSKSVNPKLQSEYEDEPSPF